MAVKQIGSYTANNANGAVGTFTNITLSNFQVPSGHVNTLLVARCGFNHRDATKEIKETGMSWNGQSLSKLAHYSHGAYTSRQGRVATYYLKNPGPATANLSMSVQHGWGVYANGWLMATLYEGVDQTNPFSAHNGGGTNSSTVSTNPADLCVACAVRDAFAVSATGGQTQEYENRIFAGFCSGYEASEGATTTASFNACDIMMTSAIAAKTYQGSDPIYFYFKREPHKWRKIFGNHELGLEGI